MKRICSSFALALGLPLSALGAQEAPAVAAGTRVRVTAPDGWRDVGPGSLEAIDSATIVVRRANGTTVAFPRERGTRLDVSGGPGACSGGHRGRCIALGFLGGAALGALAGGVLEPDCFRLLGRLVFLRTLPAGAVLGTIVGADVGGERSEEHTSELQSLAYLVCRLLLEKKKTTDDTGPRVMVASDQ